MRRLREAAGPDQQREAIEDLFETDTPEVRDAFLEALSRTRPGDGYGYNISTLISTLGEWTEQRAVKPILDVLGGTLDTGEDHQIEVQAAEALTKLQAIEALPVLSDMLFDKSRGEGIEDDLAEAIAKIGGTTAEPDLLKALSSRRSELAQAGARALCFLPSLSTAGVAALTAASRSKNAEVKTFARLAIAATSADLARAIEDLAASATDYLLRGHIVRGLRAIGKPDLSARFLPFASVPSWSDIRLDLFALLADQRISGADAVLEDAWREPETPYIGAVAGALLLGFRYAPAVVDGLLAFLGSPAASGKDDAFVVQAMACETIANALTLHTVPDRERRLRWGLLLEDARKGKVPVHPRLAAIAGDHIERIVGTRMYKDFEAWVSRQGAVGTP